MIKSQEERDILYEREQDTIGIYYTHVLSSLCTFLSFKKIPCFNFFFFIITAGFYFLQSHQLTLIKQNFSSYKSKLELTSSFCYLALNLDHLDN